MKKIIATAVAVLVLAVSILPITAFAWDNPELMLAAYFDDEKKEITLYYRVLNFTGTESADFRLRFNNDALELLEHEKAEMSNVLMEIGQLSDKPDTITIQFVDLYYAEEEDCEEDGSATVVKFTFKVKDGSATETVFIATTNSYNMDPDSTPVTTERATLKVMLNEGSKSFSTVEGYVIEADEISKDKENINKVIIAAAITAVVFVAALVVIVVKYRKK